MALMALEHIAELIERYVRDGEIDKAVDLFIRQTPPNKLEILLRLEHDTRYKILSHTPLEVLKPILAKLQEEIAFEVLVAKGTYNLVDLLTEMPSDEVADFLQKIPPRYRVRILSPMISPKKEEVESLLRYPPESVGSVMTPQIPIFYKDDTVAQAIEEYMIKDGLGLYDKHRYVYIVGKGRKFIGWLDVKTFLTRPRDKKMGEVAQKPPAVIEVTRDREEAARLAIKYDLLEIPVVDYEYRLLGAVTIDDILDVVISEYSEDLLKFGGLMDAIRESYLIAKPTRLAIKRIPAIIYLYLMNSITGSIVAGFSNIIAKAAILAAFLPMLSDNSGNIGSQASSIIIRSLVLGEIGFSKKDLLIVLSKEFLVTTLMLLFLLPIGAGIAFTITFISAHQLYYALEISVIIAFALTASCYVADIVGTLLPILLAKFRIDPAVTSAPLITTVSDIVTATTYFIVATALIP
jgi:magnesium transporter